MAGSLPPTEKNQMKAAFATWNNRIAPLFDATRQVCVVERNANNRATRRLRSFRRTAPVRKVLRLVEWGVATLVCGAISQPLESILAAHGIEVIDYVAGDVDEVIEAWLQGRIDDAAFAMPGCRGLGGRPMRRAGA
jgi:predicted Fe-Mo cluster-binding NifX family protein